MYIIISTSSDCKKILESISVSLLDKKLTPCIQICKKIKSYYIWDDKIQKKSEYKIEIKTQLSLKKEIVNVIKEMHNYKVPEIISFEFDILTSDYTKWFMKALNDE